MFYGSQWGTQTTGSNGISSFSGDPKGAAPAAQKMFKDIGTGGETWSADLTQWCDGPNVAVGATSCPSNAAFVPYQSGGVLAGVWYDNSAASPAQASGHALGVEAVNAAAHFGNTTAASNRNAYYVILSPTGTNPDDYENPSPATAPGTTTTATPRSPAALSPAPKATSPSATSPTTSTPARPAAPTSSTPAAPEPSTATR